MILVERLDLAGIDIEPEYGGGIEVVARMDIARPGCGVAYPPIDRLRVLVVIAGHPGGAAAGLPVVPLPGFVAGLAWAGNGESPPQFLAVVGVEGHDISADAELTARTADDDLAVDN